jgi:hypothetical protein
MTSMVRNVTTVTSPSSDEGRNGIAPKRSSGDGTSNGSSRPKGDVCADAATVRSIRSFREQGELGLTTRGAVLSLSYGSKASRN